MLKHGRKPVDTIFVHQTTTRPDWMADNSVKEKVAEIDRWHKGRGWHGFGYHYLIDRDGTIGKGRPETTVGAHVAGHNTGSIGISLVGGHGANKDDPFERNFTPQQSAALQELIDDIKTRADIKRIRGHSEVANKACPGFNVRKWHASTKEQMPRTSLMQSTTVQAAGVQGATGLAALIAAVGALDGKVQMYAVAFGVVVIMGAMWIARERIRKWGEGDK